MAGWLLLAVIVLGAGFFLYRVWDYSRAIKSGDLVAPPTYVFGSSKVAGLLDSSSALVERGLVEDASRPSVGPSQAPVTVVEFADFNCPYCRAEAPILRQMMTEYGGRVRFIYRHFPIIEPLDNSIQEAEAAECAFEQGKFWPYHDKIFFATGTVTTDSLLRFADEVGADRVQFERCLSDQRYQERIAADAAAGRRAGVTGTPTFFFNGQRIEGAIPEDIFKQIIDHLLQ